jgi:transcriptional regulator with XRE-family HTH domain
MSKVSPIRAYREREKISLERLADLIAAEGLTRPSTAKLSRIENGQPCPVELLPALQKIVGVPAKEIRPDLAKVFLSEVSQ